MGKYRELAQGIVRYMAEYDKDNLIDKTSCDGALAIMEAYDSTMMQLACSDWVLVARYLIEQIRPDVDDIPMTEAYELLEQLLESHLYPWGAEE